MIDGMDFDGAKAYKDSKVRTFIIRKASPQTLSHYTLSDMPIV